MFTSHTDLPGVGAKTAAKLNAFGIITIPQLLKSTNSDIPGLSKLQAKAQATQVAYTVQPTTLKSHTWFKRQSHILRSNNRIVRCQVNEVIIKHNRVQVKCTFREDGRNKSKLVTPFALLVVQQIWSQLDVVSESEDDDNEYESLSQVFQLPRLVLTDRSELDSFSAREKNSISSLVKEVQLYAIFWLA